MNVKLGRYLLNVLIVIDEVGSTLTGGDPHETISSRLGKAHLGEYGKTWKVLTAPLFYAVDWVALTFFGQKDHCVSAIDPNEGSEASL